MPTNQNYNVVEENGDWFQVHNLHEHENMIPHTHYPDIYNNTFTGRENQNRKARITTDKDIDFLDYVFKML